MTQGDPTESPDEEVVPGLNAQQHALLSLARDGLSPSAEAVRRLRSRIDVALTETSSRPSTPNRGVGRRFQAAGLGLFALGVSLGTWGGYWWGHRDAGLRYSALAPSSQTQDAPITRAISATQAPSASASTAASPTSQVVPTNDPGISFPKQPSSANTDDAGMRRGVRSEKPGPTRSTTYVDEIFLVQRVQRALARKEAQLALALLAELDSKVPNGRLNEERAAGKVIALCMSGAPSASRAFEAFKRQFSTSVHLPRAVATCAAKQSGNYAPGGDESGVTEQE